MVLYNRYIPKGNTYERVVVDDTVAPPHPPSPPFPNNPPVQPASGIERERSTPTAGTAAPGGLFGSNSALKGLSSLFGSGDGTSGGLGALLKQFKLDSLDTGDILLMLILLFLFLEGDNLELVITLGLLLLMGL
jgi:hypothetical protein